MRTDRRTLGLEPGWIPGRFVDMSDDQWRVFRSNLLILSAMMGVYVLGAHIARRFDSRHRFRFSIAFSACFTAYLHGTDSIHLWALALANYAIIKEYAGRHGFPWCIWIFNCALLIFVRYTDGISLSRINWMHFSKSYSGPVRWEIGYNLLVLRFLSFAMDLHWDRRMYVFTFPCLPQFPDAASSDPNYRVKIRSKTFLDPFYYYLENYLFYIFYPPLYLAGPISTFKNFLFQNMQLDTEPRKKRFGAGFNLLCVLLLHEGMMHYIYANSITKYRLWMRFGEGPSVFGALEFGVVTFWMIMFIWMKVLVIWRFFRFWALLDGIEAPENMCRCVWNNYDNEGLWKNWHVSFNLWVVRYIYVPLGGRKRRWLSIWVIFTFVGIWHDLEWKLLQWAWIIAMGYAIELAVKKIGSMLFSAKSQKGWFYRQLCAGCAAANVFILMTANMIGFGVGLKLAKSFVVEILSQRNFVIGTYLTLYAAVQLMFSVRQHEQDRQNRTRDS